MCFELILTVNSLISLNRKALLVFYTTDIVKQELQFYIGYSSETNHMLQAFTYLSGTFASLPNAYEKRCPSVRPSVRVNLTSPEPLNGFLCKYIWRGGGYSFVTDYTVRGWNPGGGEASRTPSDRPWGPPGLPYRKMVSDFSPGVEQPWRGSNHPPHLAQRLK